MNRRKALLLSAIGLASVGAYRVATSSGGYAQTELNASIKKMTDLNLAPNPETVTPFSLSNDEWRERLEELAYHVLREEGTERPFTSELNDEKRAGHFACSGCGLVLFTQEQKFDSGTGWPSFFDSIEGRIETKTDFKLVLPRTEYHCARCGGHQGHVFKDGPKPTGLRYCNNGVALNFTPA